MRISIQTIPDCPNAAGAMSLVLEQVQALGLEDVVVTERVITSNVEASFLAFHGSPTFVINGVDPFATPDTSVAFACRVYRDSGSLRGLPGASILRAAIAEAAAAPAR